MTPAPKKTPSAISNYRKTPEDVEKMTPMKRTSLRKKKPMKLNFTFGRQDGNEDKVRQVRMNIKERSGRRRETKWWRKSGSPS
jgi:hypothetical protein